MGHRFLQVLAPVSRFLIWFVGSGSFRCVRQNCSSSAICSRTPAQPVLNCCFWTELICHFVEKYSGLLSVNWLNSERRDKKLGWNSKRTLTVRFRSVYSCRTKLLWWNQGTRSSSNPACSYSALIQKRKIFYQNKYRNTCSYEENHVIPSYFDASDT